MRECRHYRNPQRRILLSTIQRNAFSNERPCQLYWFASLFSQMHFCEIFAHYTGSKFGHRNRVIKDKTIWSSNSLKCFPWEFDAHPVCFYLYSDELLMKPKTLWILYCSWLIEDHQYILMHWYYTLVDGNKKYKNLIVFCPKKRSNTKIHSFQCYRWI